jgi:hypothetical protein
MADLVDADPLKAGEQIHVPAGLGHDALDDRPDRPPRHAHQLRRRALGAVHGQPRHLIFEAAREACLVARPRHRADHDTVLRTRHPGRIGLHKRLRQAQVRRPPAPAALTKIEPGAATPTHPAAVTLMPARPRPDHNLSLRTEEHVLDHRGAQPKQPRPYPRSAHVVSAPIGSSPRQAGTLGTKRRAPPSGAHLTHGNSRSALYVRRSRKLRSLRQRSGNVPQVGASVGRLAKDPPRPSPTTRPGTRAMASPRGRVLRPQPPAHRFPGGTGSGRRTAAGARGLVPDERLRADPTCAR